MNRYICGAVVIGRNEGDRLIACLDSLLRNLDCIVYVDSGSSDESLLKATELGVDCISLDLSIPFTAARARNAGASHLLKKYPSLMYIQFVDGDCEVQPNWVKSAMNYLDHELEYAAVCGRRREIYPDKSIYNLLCDIEWNTPVGDAMTCGGDALLRVSAFFQVNGYRGDLIAGEEPEICFRLREQGWKIFRLDEEMTLHDAAIMRLDQWWNRAKRAGYAYANGYYLHGHSAEKYNARQVLSILFWAAILPILIVLISFLNNLYLSAFLIYPIQICHLMLIHMVNVGSYKNSFYYALSNVFGKYPQWIGMMRFTFNKWKGRNSTLIEYK